MRFPVELIIRISGAASIRKPAMKAILVIVLFGLLLMPNVSAVDKLLQSSDLSYIGSFRVPHENFGPSSFDAGGGQATYYPAHNSLFLSGSINSFHVAEISIPAPKTGSLAGMNTATVLQSFSDPSEGRSGNIRAGGACCIENGVKLGGLLVHDNKLIGTSFSYYDPEPYYAVRSHFVSGLNLAATDASGMFELSGLPLTREGTHGASFASGWMAEIPAAYQSALGATHITGNGSLNKINRTSWGPSAFAANLGQLGVHSPPAGDSALLLHRSASVDWAMERRRGNLSDELERDRNYPGHGMARRQQEHPLYRPGRDRSILLWHWCGVW